MTTLEETSTPTEPGQAAAAVSDATIDSIPESISLGDYDPEGPIGASAAEAFGDLLGDATAAPEVTGDKPEEQAEEETSGELPVEDDADTDEPDSASDDTSDIETDDAETDEEGETETTNPELFHIDDLKEENVQIEMKVDGEVRTYSANEIQKILGAEAVATRKSKTASQDLEKAQAMLNDAELRIATAAEAEELASSNEELSLYKAQYAQLSRQLEEADDYEYGQLSKQRDTVAKAHNEKLNEVNQKKNQVNSQRTIAVRSRLEQSERGKRFLNEGQAVESFNKHLADAGVTQAEFNAVKHSPAIIDMLLEHQELKQSTQPVARKKKSVSKTLRKSASTTPAKTSTKPRKGSTAFSDRMKSGESVSIQELSDGKVHLDVDL